MYGAEDMLLNAFELYVPNPAAPVFGAARYLLIDWEAASIETVRRETGFFPYLSNMELPSGFGGNFAQPWDRAKLSRLYKRTVALREPNTPAMPIDLMYAVLLSNVGEVAYAIRPVARWYSTVGERYEISTTPVGDALELAPVLRRADFAPVLVPIFGVWSSTVINYSQELGYPPATNGTLLSLPERSSIQKGEQYPHDLFYILPVGFRCAR
jgi:hypothetical protein